MNPKNFITCETDDNTTDFQLITRYQLYRYMYTCVCVATVIQWILVNKRNKGLLFQIQRISNTHWVI